jgi:Na+-transporting NADH:ubiquinone oxidoreductase subunit E
MDAKFKTKTSEIMELANIFVRSIFIDNMIFAYFLGMCSYLAVSKNVKTAFGLGVAVCFVLIITMPVNYLINKYLLQSGALKWISADWVNVDLSFLTLIIFIAVIAAIVQLLEMVIERFSVSLYQALGIFLPLIAVNCAILGGSLFMQEKNFPDVTHSFVYALGSGIGWMLAIVAFAAIRDRLKYSDIPKPLQGNGIAYIITGLMGIGFMAFLGI